MTKQNLYCRDVQCRFVTVHFVSATSKNLCKTVDKEKKKL